MGRLHRQVAIVTGGASGIGRAIVERFAEEGAIVYCLDLEVAVHEPPPRVRVRQADVSRASDWTAVVEEAMDDYGRVDVLVNNAGIGTWETATELSEETWQRVIDVHQKGSWLGLREVLPKMVAQGGGSVINMSSICGLVARPEAFAYHAAKGALTSMTRNAAVTYAPSAVRVNAIAPGFIVTPLTNVQDAAINDEFIARTPLGHAGSPLDIANGALYLASHESRFVTGITLAIDGGYLAQ
ncbi:MAG: SDR family oxidoreductase [Actinobacteria bacterium]|nr:SDR family oxidoreductase [Actinomycetota bacterium]